MKTLSLLSFAGIVSFALSGAAFAQTNSLFGNNRTTGGTTTGGGRTGAPAANTEFGQAPTAAGGQGAAEFGQVNNATQGGLVGRNNNVGRFVGQQNAAQQNNRVNRNFQGVQNTARNANSRNAGADPFGAQSGSGRTTTLRPVTRIAFRYPQRVTANINVTLRTRFTRLAVRRPLFRGINASLGGNGEVVLSGTVGSEDAKVLAANLARLEPGVRTVTNRLVVR